MSEALSLEGVPVERFWEVAREAGLNLSTVMAIAGGHSKSMGNILPVIRTREAARRISERRPARKVFVR